LVVGLIRKSVVVIFGWIDDETALQWLFSFHEATIKLVKKGRPRLLLMVGMLGHRAVDRDVLYGVKRNVG
jgi:hypothetical protein